MKVLDVETPYEVPHIADRSFMVTIISKGDERIRFGGIPAVARHGESWFSGELIELDGETVLAAVNGYGYRNEARYDAERRR